MPAREDRLIADKPIPAKVLNLLPEGAERLLRTEAGGGLTWSDLGIGPILADTTPEKIPVRLSGSGPAYDWAEVYPNPDGTWSTLTGGRSGTGNAYEANSKTGLGSDIVHIAYQPSDDYRFYLPRIGTPAFCRHTAVTVNGCPKAGLNNWTVSGVTVQLLSGVTVVDSQVTDSSGAVSLGYPSTGTYTLKAIPPNVPWWKQTPVTQTVSLNCGANSGWQLTLVPATGFTCKCPGCRDPLPATATLTDGNGTFAMTYFANPPTGWRCCYTIPGGADHTVDGLGNCVPATGDTVIGYLLLCNFVLIETWCSCEITPPYHLIPGTCISGLPQDTPTGGLKTPNSGGVAASSATDPNNCNDALSFVMIGTPVSGTVAVSFP